MSIKFGIIGCGRIAKRHAQHISAHLYAELVSCFDIKQDASDEFANNYNIESESSLDRLLLNPSIDIVSICAPNGVHKEIAILALKVGKNVLVEKPMALNKEDCQVVHYLPNSVTS
ncbi:MAG: Gfo/Idh/MocA family oxidoreductase [Bacteroidetes bacterium]|nr:Gfo/Idh/MocA family oxidoreductase [Bacteroidota bacterium]